MNTTAAYITEYELAAMAEFWSFELPEGIMLAAAVIPGSSRPTLMLQSVEDGRALGLIAVGLHHCIALVPGFPDLDNLGSIAKAVEAVLWLSRGLVWEPSVRRVPIEDQDLPEDGEDGPTIH